MRLTPKTRIEAVRHLKRADDKLKNVIRRVGKFTLRPERNRYAMLVKSILSQQISTSAAKSIRLKLLALVDQKLEPERIGKLRDEQLRSAGISPQKLRYLRDLTDRVTSSELRLTQMGRYSDEDVIQQLTTVKGIGRWTAQMFLIFSLGRLDILPHDDLGIQNAIRKLYDLSDRPDRVTMERIAEPWRPFASVASWYCWRSLEDEDW
ncbi:MAG: DNA-3-methyladenine glycosylase [Planctomycetaceae bacterium]